LLEVAFVIPGVPMQSSSAVIHLVFYQSALTSQFPLQFFLAGQRETIARGEQLLASDRGATLWSTTASSPR